MMLRQTRHALTVSSVERFMFEGLWIGDPVMVKGDGTSLLWLDDLLWLSDRGNHPFACYVDSRLGPFPRKQT